MRYLQPNFEKVKTALYQKVVDTQDFYFRPLFITITTGNLQQSHYGNRIVEQRKQLNTYIDNLSIGSIACIIDSLQDTNLVGWIKNKKFTIDYNKHEMLDLIKLDNELE